MDDESVLKLLKPRLDGTEPPKDLPLALFHKITNGFSPERKIGRGGFGAVYKGVLPNGIIVAVKRIYVNLHKIDDDDKLFEREFNSLWNAKHPNVVRFLGFCSNTYQTPIEKTGSEGPILGNERVRLLCFEYISNGSLDKHITDELRGLEWETRYEIITGICMGLRYLHEEINFIHMDLKPANILLDHQDEKYIPKIADFGLSRPNKNSHTVGRCYGTPGYWAPENRFGSQTIPACDIYSLGAIIMELVTGGMEVTDKHNVLRRWRHRWNKPPTPLQYQQVTGCIDVAVRCREENQEARPSIKEIIDLLNESTNGHVGKEISTYTDDDMLGIEPLKLHFNKKMSWSVKLANKTKNYFFFNIEGPSKQYTIRPEKGLVPPGSENLVQITAQPQEVRQNGDKFIVRTTKEALIDEGQPTLISSNLRSQFIGMGFSPMIVDKKLQKHGDHDSNTILESLLSHSAPQNSGSESSSSLGSFFDSYNEETGSPLVSSIEANQDMKPEPDSFLERKSYLLSTMNFCQEEVDLAFNQLGEEAPLGQLVDFIVTAQGVGFSEGKESGNATNEGMVESLHGEMDKMVSLHQMGFTEEEVSSAIVSFGQEATNEELADSIFARRIANTIEQKQVKIESEFVGETETEYSASHQGLSYYDDEDENKRFAKGKYLFRDDIGASSSRAVNTPLLNGCVGSFSNEFMKEEGNKVVDEVDLIVVHEPVSPEAIVSSSYEDGARRQLDRRNFHPPENFSSSRATNLTYLVRVSDRAMDVTRGAMGSLLHKLGVLHKEFNLETSVKKDADELVKMHNVLCKVSDVQQDNLDDRVKLWASNVRDMSYDLEDFVDRFLVHSEPASDGSSFKGLTHEIYLEKGKSHQPIAHLIKHHIGKQVQYAAEECKEYNVDNTIANATAKADIEDPRFSTIYIDREQLIGIEGPRNELITLLEVDGPVSGLKIVSIVGLGGLGKTTLAQEVHGKLQAQYHTRAFVSVGRNPDVKDVFKSIIDELDKNFNAANLGTLKLLRNKVKGLLDNKRYFIVIDDIWDSSEWNCLRPAFPENENGSRLMITTRNHDVALACCNFKKDYVYGLKELSEVDSRSLLFTRIFGSKEDCHFTTRKEEISKNILNRCGGMPLAINNIANLLARDASDSSWEYVLKSLGATINGNIDLENMKKILDLSYIHLPDHLKTCLHHVCMHPEDREIDKNDLVRQWVA